VFSQVPEVLTKNISKYVDVIHVFFEKIIVLFGNLQVPVKNETILLYFFENIHEGLVQILWINFRVVVFAAVKNL